MSRLRRPGVRAGREGHPHVDRRVGDGLVALGELVVGERRPVAGAVRRDPVVLDEQAALVDLLERPPDRLDVLRVHRAVGLAHVDPAAHPIGHLLPQVDVALHRLTAPGVELRDAEGLDVGLAGEPELLLHRELDGQAVAVPASLAVDLVALHGLEPREHVLERPRLDVVGAGPAVGRGRALEEGPGLGAVVAGHGLLEDLAARARSPAPRTRARAGRPAGGRGGTSTTVVLRFDDELSMPKGRGRRSASPRYHPPWPAPCCSPTHSMGDPGGSTAAGSSPRRTREDPSAFLPAAPG